jgi:hypothetical protein
MHLSLSVLMQLLLLLLNLVDQLLPVPQYSLQQGQHLPWALHIRDLLSRGAYGLQQHVTDVVQSGDNSIHSTCN